MHGVRERQKERERERLRGTHRLRLDAVDGWLLEIQQVWFPPLDGMFFTPLEPGKLSSAVRCDALRQWAAYMRIADASRSSVG